MIRFKPPELSDRGWLYDLASRSNLRSADFSFGNIYCWSSVTNSMIARLGDRLLVRFCIRGRCMYSYPVGSGDIMPAFAAIMEDADNNGVDFLLRGVTPAVLPEVMSLRAEKPELTMDENLSDYVYSAEKLASLTGKKYHSKKNHVNRFMAERNWRFEPITPENIGACRQMASEWFVTVGEARGSDYLSEIRAIRTAFDIFFDAGFEGGVIWDGDQVAAFTMGELLSPDTFNTHFEKAHPEINGAYAIINQQFAKYLLEKHPGLIYINREEDMGLENLRRAKQSYHPGFMIDKYTAVWKNG